MKDALRLHVNGAALITSMLFLIVMTLLGLAGMNNARLETLLAGNNRFQTRAFSNVEYILAVAEQDAFNLSGNPFSPDRAGDHYYAVDTPDFNPATANIAEQPSDRLWNFSYAVVQLPDLNNDGSDSDANGIADDGTGHYVIQNGGSVAANGEDASVSGTLRPLPGSRVQALVVTARSTHTRGAYRSVQSVVTIESLKIN